MSAKLQAGIRGDDKWPDNDGIQNPSEALQSSSVHAALHALQVAELHLPDKSSVTGRTITTNPLFVRLCVRVHFLCSDIISASQETAAESSFYCQFCIELNNFH